MATFTPVVHVVRGKDLRIVGSPPPFAVFPPNTANRARSAALTFFSPGGGSQVRNVIGDATISGTVLDGGVPVRRRVRLYAELEGSLVEERWSDPNTGAYSFEGLSRDAVFTLVSYDHTGSWRAEIFNGVKAT